MLTSRYDDAFRYAHHLHRAQTRKGSGVPYVAHLMAVSSLVVEHGGDEDQAIAALLHDAAEDQGGAATLEDISRQFGHDVAAIVSDCTDSWEDPKPAWRPRKEAYLRLLGTKPARSLLVSLADKTHNAEAILTDYLTIGDEIWNRFNGGADGTRWYYGALNGLFSSLLPGPLSGRLDRAARGFLDPVGRG